MRHNTRVGLGALALALTVTASACGTTDTGGSASDGGACEGKIGVMGALSGANSSIVLPSVDGAKLALKQCSADNKDCKIELVEFDTEGDPAKATPVANKMATDETFLGVIGGAFSGETRATKAIYGDAGLTMISQSATATDLTQEDPSPVFHRVVGYDDVQGAAIAKYLSEVIGAKKVFVIDDSDAYGEPLAAKVSEELGDLVVASDKTQVAQTDFSPTVSKVNSSKPDAIFYGGYIAEAAPLLKQLRDAGIDAPFVGGDGLYGADFGKAAGSAGRGRDHHLPLRPDRGRHVRGGLRGRERRGARRVRRRGLRRHEHLPGRVRRRRAHPRGGREVRRRLRQRGPHQAARVRRQRRRRQGERGDLGLQGGRRQAGPGPGDLAQLIVQCCDTRVTNGGGRAVARPPLWLT